LVNPTITKFFTQSLSIDGGAISFQSIYDCETGSCFSPVAHHLSSVFTSGTVTSTITEPSTWAMMLLGFGLLGGVGYRRRRSVAIAA
jgi:hypothetical protein